jgi:lipopolysaccharide/colanic/teichoic acid biosynthesis glycosyltransferase
MPFLYRRDQIILFVGDLLVFAGSLWAALVLRHFVVPALTEYGTHLLPFSFLFVLWLIVFVTVGLYDKHIALFEYNLPATITEAQFVNLIIAALFFFTLPISIQPKTILALYFVISTALIVVWRLGLFRYRALQRHAESALIVGTGPDIAELRDEIRKTPRTRIDCAEFLDSDTVPAEILVNQVTDMLQRYKLRTLIVDSRLLTKFVALQQNPAYDVIDAALVYESLFDRVPLTLIQGSEFLVYRSTTHAVYDIFKRALDIALSFILTLILLILLPFVWAATRLQGPGPLFIQQERIGRGWGPMYVNKFRTMRLHKAASQEWTVEEKKDNPVTKVGAFLRRTSIDELPQVFSVLKGDLSLIGPRSDIMGLGERLAEELPFYRMRYSVTPGISGWAQVNQHYAPGNISPQSIEESRVRLQYDLYYVKYRSLFLDLSITLKTLKTLLKRIIP